MSDPTFDTDQLGQRIVAQIVDQVVVVTVTFLLVGIASVVLGIAADFPVGPSLFLGLVYGVPILSIVTPLPYSVLFETVWDGQTPGKRVLDIRVVDASGGPPSLVQVLLRNLSAVYLFSPFQHFVAVIAIAVSEDHQRLFDMAASTYVVE